jgi:putative acetyltransferase
MDSLIVVRPESEVDWPTVDDIVCRAFDDRPNEVALVRRLREAGPSTISRVAAIDGRVVAHLMCSPLGIEGSPASVLSLAPVAVDPEQQGRGLGARLVSSSMAELDAAAVPLVVVLGEPDYYGRFGFKPAADYGIAGPAGMSPEHLQVLPLRAYDPSLRGVLIYPSVFAETGTI